MRKLFYLLSATAILCMLFSSCQQSKSCSAHNSYEQYQKKDNKSYQSDDSSYKQFQKKANTSKHSGDKGSKHYQKENPF